MVTPVIITTVPITAIQYPFQRKTFWANGRFFVFYSDGTYFVWAHSANGVNWSLPSQTILTNSPTQTSSPGPRAWINPTYAFSLDGLYADGVPGLATAAVQDYYGYGFSLPSDTVIAKVRIRLDAAAGNTTGATLYVQVSWDNGVTWGPARSLSLPYNPLPPFSTYYIDVTGDTTWTPTKVGNIQVRLTVYRGQGEPYVDWVPVEVTYYSGQAVTQSVAPVGQEASFWFDGIYLHYAHAHGVANMPVHYRRGKPNSDGTITWSAPEQIAVPADPSLAYSEPFVSVDKDGYPFIGYVTTSYPFVTKSSTNDGTWVTDTGFPLQLSTSAQSAWDVTVVPLTGKKMYALYVYDIGTFQGRLWNGSSWGSEESPTSMIAYNANFVSVTTYGNDVHLAFTRNVATYDLIHVKRMWPTGWGTETTVQTPTVSGVSPAISTFGPGNLIMFWVGAPRINHIYYKQYINGVWDTNPTELVYEIQGVTEDKLDCSYQTYGPTPLLYITFIYVDESVPNNLKFLTQVIFIGTGRGDGLFWTIS